MIKYIEIYILFWCLEEMSNINIAYKSVSIQYNTIPSADFTSI